MPYSVCVIGLGAQGMTQIKQLMVNPQKWSIVGVVDQSKLAYVRFQSLYYDCRIPFFNDIVEAIHALDTIDAIVISTTAPPRVAISRSILSTDYSGCLLLEKPISTSVVEARSLREQVYSRNMQDCLRVDYNRRAADFYRWIKRTIQAGELGSPLKIEYNRPCKINMKASHQIDLVNWLLNAQPVSVNAQLDQFSQVDHRGAYFFDPGGCVEIKYSSGVTFSLNTGDGAQELVQGLKIDCEDGTLHVNDEETTTVVRAKEKERQIVLSEGITSIQWFEATLEALVDDKSDYSLCTIDEAIICLEIMLGAHISSRLGGETVELPLNGENGREELRIA